MERGSPFGCPSSTSALKLLLDRTREALWVCLGAALFPHPSLTQWRGLVQQEKAARPLTTQFMKRRPRLTKPLELRETHSVVPMP